jgi:hypothetical protein
MDGDLEVELEKRLRRSERHHRLSLQLKSVEGSALFPNGPHLTCTLASASSSF